MALSSVVLPDPVPPATMVDMRPCTMARMISSMRPSNDPLAIRASGVSASQRRFMPAAMRSMANFTWSSSSKQTSVSMSLPERSTHTDSGPLTMISESDSSYSRSSSGPK